MNEDRDLTNTPLYKILTYITDFLFTNLCFLLVISPLILYIFSFNENSSIAAILFISILLGPALTTSFSVMGKLLRNKYISPIKDFFHFYKLNFLQGLLVSIVLNIIISICYFDMNYFKSNGNTVMAGLFFIVIILSVLLGLYIYPLLSRYSMKIIHAFKLSLRLMVTKFYISFTCISIIIIILFIIKKASIALIGLLLGVSVISYLIMVLENKMISDLEEEIRDKYRTN